MQEDHQYNFMTYAKVDETQKPIVQALRAAGAFVQSLADIGHGCPDILVLYHGKAAVWELKSGPKAKLTDDEFNWHSKARLQGGYTVPVVDSVEMAMKRLTKF